MKFAQCFTFAFFILRLCQSLVLIDSTLASACIYYELQYDWGCNSHANGMKAYACRCRNVNWLGSVTNCIYNGSSSKRLVDHALRHLSTRCLQKADLHYTLDDMYFFLENGSHYLRDPTAEDRLVSINTTLRVNETDYQWYYKNFKDYTFSVERSQWFGWGLVFYWTTIIGFATAINICRKISGISIVNNWTRKHIVLPSVFKDYQERTYMCFKILPFHFPTRLHGFIVGVFVILTMISVGVGYEMTLPNPYLTSRWYMNLNLVSYRTDLMAMSLFPIIYLFGIRNNPFIFISGLSYPVFQFYHRWCAYVCVVLAFIHSIIWTVWAIADGGYQSWAVDAYWNWGIAATTLAVLLVSHSGKLLRDCMYEFFLVCHQFMNIAFIVCMYYHCNILGWLGWIWSMAGILCFDRLMRILRIIISGGVHNATLTDCGNGSIVKVVVKKPKFFKYSAGSYAFIYFLSPTDAWYYFFQSHPFTILMEPQEDINSHGNLVFYFKASKGVTRTVLKKIMRSGKMSVTCKILLEGPYGTSLPQMHILNRRTVGLAAGLGVCAVYPHFRTLFEAPDREAVNLRHKLIWIVNDLSSVEWFGQELEWLRSRGCELCIIYTKNDAKDLEAASSKSLTSDSKFDVEKVYARPDLNRLVSSEIKDSSDKSNDLTFISCGPPAFNDELRYAVANGITNDLKIDVDFKAESFTW